MYIAAPNFQAKIGCMTQVISEPGIVLLLL